MKHFLTGVIAILLFLGLPTIGLTQDTNDKLFSEKTFKGLELRSVGPAFMSGRIADLAIHPDDESIWYVAVGSGGVWKTSNAGTTWEPIFDKQSVYSIGCVTIDPHNPSVIWVGTGENVGGRHVSFGDGIYKSQDGGKTWENMGLKESQHISKIIIHPSNPDIVWVAVQGPLWNKGGERGLYKSTDGGKTWTKKLGDDEWVGVTDIQIDPRNPEQMYAATWQRHRTVAAYMGGGPGSAIHRSSDGGESWEKLKEGLPKSNMGKIGLAISPQKPDIIYAAIELNRRTGGVFKSTDRGSSWEKQSNAVGGATGPHYYQELYASPHQFDKLFLVDNRMQVSEDGGKTFKRMSAKGKHGDNHAVAFKMSDPDYLLVGTDGGVYETFDNTQNWRFIHNLPLTQFYKLALDDAEPFYNIYGGTQDNGTQTGPSRTDNGMGITNEDWKLVLYADGHQPATEPGNPDIFYAEWQEGHLVRIDRTTGEIVAIQPQPEPGDDYERFNWDSPILVSPHSPTRIFFASQRVWQSDDRGDNWKAISDDLTRNEERLTLPIMDKNWSWDAAWDVSAMSTYNTITSLAESPLAAGLIYAGTDDGIVQVTEDSGGSWRKIEVGSLPDVPSTAFVNDIKADLYDANTVYVALDNHKYGDLKPYLLKSTNKGKSWKSIAGNLPEKTLVWRLVQDHVNPDLLFCGTEFGIYFTVDGGANWVRLKGGAPTISFRDLAIQRRENDLVGASFGRSFYILDDYSVLRTVSENQLKEEATLFPSRDARWYIQRLGKGSQGASFYTAKNPPFGAVFTYYLADTYKSKKDIRKEKEKELTKQNADVPFPGWDEIEAERMEAKPIIWLTVKDKDGNVIRRIKGPVTKGFHRVAWDLSYPSQKVIDVNARPAASEWWRRGMSAMAVPGTYTVSLSKQLNGEITDLSQPVEFNIVPLRKGSLEGASEEEVVAFWKEIRELQGEISTTSFDLNRTIKKVKGMQRALKYATQSPGQLDTKLHSLLQTLMVMDAELNGNRSKAEVGEKYYPTVKNRLGVASSGVAQSTYGPTPLHERNLELAKEGYLKISADLNNIIENQIPGLEIELKEAGAPEVR